MAVGVHVAVIRNAQVISPTESRTTAGITIDGTVWRLNSHIVVLVVTVLQREQKCVVALDPVDTVWEEKYNSTLIQRITWHLVKSIIPCAFCITAVNTRKYCWECTAKYRPISKVAAVMMSHLSGKKLGERFRQWRNFLVKLFTSSISH